MADNLTGDFDWEKFNRLEQEATKKVDNVTNEFIKQTQADRKTYAATSYLNKNVPNGFERNTMIQNYLSGNSLTGPNPAAKIGTPIDKQVNLFADKLRNSKLWQDEFNQYKVTGFNGSRYGLNYNRYYNSNGFNKFGFSPHRENESLYNNNSSWWDNFSRMLGTWPTMFLDNTIGQYQNWGDYSLAGDIKNANKMQDQMSIGYDSNGGFGASVNNLVGNFSYTASIIASVALEELAIGAVTAVTKSPTLAASGAARTGFNLKRVGQAISNSLDYVKGVKSLRQTIGTLKDVSKAKDFYNGAKTLGVGVGSAAFRVLNPLENLGDFARGFNQLKTVDKLSDAALLARGFGAFYRDMRAINFIFDEAKLEGGFVQTEMFDKLTEEYIQENGKLPDPESDDAKRIYQAAKRAGDKTTLVNIPAIMYSNKIVLDRAIRGFASSARKTSQSIIVNNRNWKALGKNAYSKINNNISKFTKAAFWRQAPKNVTASLLTYGAANYVEGLQELYQEGASVAVKDYYTSLYKSPMIAGSKEPVLAAMGKGFESQMSSQGLDVFLSGFLMGGLASGAQTAITAPVKVYEKYGPDKIFGIEIQNKEELKKQREEQEKKLDELIDALNFFEMNQPGGTKRDIFNAISENAAEIRNLAIEMEGALLKGDAKTFHDAKNAMLVKHLHTLLSNDRYDLFINQLKELRDLDDSALLEVIGETTEEEKGENVRRRLEETISKAEQYKSNWNKFNTRFGRYSFPKDNITGKAYETARLHYTFNMNNIEVVAERMQNMLNEVVSNPAYKKIAATDLSVLFDMPAMQLEIRTLQNEVSVYTGKGATAEQKELAKEKQIKLDRLSKMYTALENMNSLNKILETKDSRVAQIFEENKTEEEFRGGFTAKRDEYNKSVQEALDQMKAILNNIDVEIAASTEQSEIDQLNASKQQVQERIDQLNSELTTENAEYDKVMQMTRQEYLDYETEKNQELLTKNVEALREAYFGYMKDMAGLKEDSLLDDDLEESLSKLIDFYALKDDQRRAVTAVNVLSNPRNFAEHVERLSGIFEDIKNNRTEYLKQGFREFLNIKSENLFFQELYDHGMFLDIDSIEDFRAGKMPNFYLAPTDLEKGDYVEVNASSNDPAIIEKYNQAMELLARHEARIGRPLMEKTIIERKGTEGFDESGFRKDVSDKRGLRELAGTFGVDPTQRTDKSTKEVLAAIMASPQATEAEAMLARLLIPIVRNDSTIAFVYGLEQPGTTGTATGIQIDLRYGASEYKNANTPMERIVIREVLKGILTVEYNKDDAFKAEVDRLFDNAKNWFQLEENKEKYEALYELTPLGLTSPEMFMTEAMSNPRFQALLGLIKSSKPNKTSIFQDLIDTIRKVLLQILTGNMKNSMAQEAIDIISTRIFAPPTITGITPKLKDTSIESINEAIQKENFDSLPKELLAEMQAEAIANKASDYVEFYKSAPTIQAIINRFALKSYVQPEPFDEALLNLTAEQKAEHLSNLGYTEDEINKMSPEDQNTIIDNLIFAPGSEQTKKREMVLIDIKKRLMPITNKNLELKTKEVDGKKISYYVDENGDEFGRVSDLKPEFTGKANAEKAAAARGTHTDDILRTYLDPDNDIVTFDAFVKMASDMMQSRKNSTDQETRESFAKLNMTIDYYKDLYIILKNIRNTLKKTGFVLLTDVPTLWGQIDGNRAGTIDMLAVNGKGEVFIIDLKTSEANRFEATKTYQYGDTVQLNAYRELLKQRTGIDVKNILVLPIEVVYDNKAKAYTAAQRSSTTIDGKKTQTMTIDSSKNIFEILGLQAPEKLESAYEQELAQAMAALNQFPERYGFASSEEVQKLTSDQVLEVFRKGPVTAEAPVETIIEEGIEEKPAAGTQGELELEFEAQPVKIKKQFLGKIIYATPGSGKTTLSRMYPDSIIDMDQVMADIIEETLGMTLSDIQRNDIGGVIYDLLVSGELDSKTFYDRVHKEMKALKKNNKDKIILTGTLKFIEAQEYKNAIDVVMIAADPVDFINHMQARGNTAEEIEAALSKYRLAENLFGATALKKQKIINIGPISSDSNLANVISGQKDVTKAMTVNKEDSQIILNFGQKVREAGTDLEQLLEIQKQVQQYIANRAKDMVTIDIGGVSEMLAKKISEAKGEISSLETDTKKAVKNDDSEFPNGTADENDSDLPSDCGA